MMTFPVTFRATALLCALSAPDVALGGWDADLVWEGGVWFPAKIAVADVDGDGDSDIVACFNKGGGLRWFANDGELDPVWTEKYVGGTDCIRLAVGDFDGDGMPDLAMTTDYPWKSAVYLNRGAADDAWEYHPLGGTLELSAADVDRDGRDDLLARETIYYSQGNGEFDLVGLPTGTQYLSLANVDSSGAADLFYGIYGNGAELGWVEKTGEDPESWTKHLLFDQADLQSPQGVLTRDLDNDGDDDLLAPGVCETVAMINPGGHDADWSLLTVAGGPCDYSIQRADAGYQDADDYMDLVVADSASGAVTVARGDGSPGIFSGPSVVDTGVEIPWSAKLGDIDGAGHLDVVVGSSMEGQSYNSIVWYREPGIPLCGDAILSLEEECEDGNREDGDGCDRNCTYTGCGNGRKTLGEECDDGNFSNSDACLSSCVEASCGDGFLRAGFESCDDGNITNGDGCDDNCTETACGNGVPSVGEGCDDGNGSNADECLTNCDIAACGDGFVYAGVEECDDGGSADGDGCSRSCEFQRLCGDATGDGSLLASDALRILQRAVGTDVDCPTWICDVDGVSGVTTSDALRILRRTVELPGQLSCGDPTGIVVRITTSATLGSLQLKVNYQGAAGEIDGEGGTVDCQVLQRDVQAAFNDKPEKLLLASFVSLPGIKGPGSVARCGFSPSANVAPEDFAVTVLDAKDSNGNTAPKPGVRVIPD